MIDEYQEIPHTLFHAHAGKAHNTNMRLGRNKMVEPYQSFTWAEEWPYGRRPWWPMQGWARFMSRRLSCYTNEALQVTLTNSTHNISDPRTSS